MEEDKKKLIQLKAKLELYRKIDNKINQVLNAELEVEELSEEIYNEIAGLEEAIFNLKIDMDLSDAEWSQDENVY